jgi:hypothetical protein
MDPITMIIAALTAGAVAGAQGTATDAMKDAYAGLRALVHRRFRGRASAETALEQHESKPEAWRGELEAELVDVDADQDIALVEAAQRLMALLDAAGTRTGKYQVDVRGAQGVQVGDHGAQTNYFGYGQDDPVVDPRRGDK